MPRGRRTLYKLDYANSEVRLSLNAELLSFFSKNGRVPVAAGRSLCTHRATNDFESFGDEPKAGFASFRY